MENSIEEDIKLLENIIKGNEDCISAIYSQMKVKNDNDEDIQYYKKEIQAIQNVLSDYKRVLKENEELKGELKDSVIAIKLYALQTENEKQKELIEKMKNYLLKENKMCDFLESEE